MQRHTWLRSFVACAAGLGGSARLSSTTILGREQKQPRGDSSGLSSAMWFNVISSLTELLFSVDCTFPFHLTKPL